MLVEEKREYIQEMYLESGCQEIIDNFIVDIYIPYEFGNLIPDLPYPEYIERFSDNQVEELYDIIVGEK